MLPQVSYIAQLYRVNAGLFDKAVGQAKPSAVSARPLDKANSFQYVAAHITNARYQLANLLGLPDQYPHAALFEFGAEPKEASAYPPLEEIRASFQDITAKLNRRLEEVTEKDLKGEPPFKMSDVEPTIGGLVALFQLHESYHVGQLAYILRLHGGGRLLG